MFMIFNTSSYKNHTWQASYQERIFCLAQLGIPQLRCCVLEHIPSKRKLIYTLKYYFVRSNINWLKTHLITMMSLMPTRPILQPPRLCVCMDLCVGAPTYACVILLPHIPLIMHASWWMPSYSINFFLLFVSEWWFKMMLLLHPKDSIARANYSIHTTLAFIIRFTEANFIVKLIIKLIL